jgi:hypothetical protein
MKKTIKFLIPSVMLLLLPALAALPAAAQVIPTYSVKCIKSNFVANTVTSNLHASLLITNVIGQGKHMGVGYSFVGGDATNTGLVGLQFDILFATNSLKTTTQPITVTGTANGVTAVIGWSVVPEYTLGPGDKIVLSSITNALANKGLSASNAITVSNVWLEWRN